MLFDVLLVLNADAEGVLSVSSFCSQHLQLLSLASNDIMDIENLTCLRNLKALDISYNLLDEVPPDELPNSLLFLTTDGNPLRKMVARRRRRETLRVRAGPGRVDSVDEEEEEATESEDGADAADADDESTRGAAGHDEK
eukprot:763980-Hanusia_phi.AAC.3